SVSSYRLVYGCAGNLTGHYRKILVVLLGVGIRILICLPGDDRDRCEVLGRRRGPDHPLQTHRAPGVRPCSLAITQGPEEVDYRDGEPESQNRGARGGQDLIDLELGRIP